MKSRQKQTNRPRITRPSPRLKRLLLDLEYLDELRETLNEQTGCFIATLREDGDLLRSYLRFLESGGVTAQDLRRYLQGRQIQRTQRIITRKHGRLRLVISQPVTTLGLKLRKRGDDDAA